jgi:hypothetical protein
MLIFALALALGGGGDPPFSEADELPTDLRDSAPTGYTFRLSPAVRWITGHTTVREHEVEGTRLDLNGDLGLRAAAGANAQFEMEAPGIQVFAEVEELFGWGGQSADQPFAWNGTTYTAPSQVRVHASFLTVRGELAFKLLSSDDGRSWLAPIFGFEWPYYTISVGTNLQHGSLEDWVHYLPYTIVGVAGRVALSDDVDLQARLVGGYLPNLPTIYTEGGRLYVSVRPSLSLEVPLLWRVGRSWELSFTATYQYWAGWDHSTEDGNQLTFSSLGVMIGVGYRW